MSAEPYPVFIRSGIDTEVVQKFKQEILRDAEETGMEFSFHETDDELADILASIRAKDTKPAVIAVIDKDSVEESAVLMVESQQYDCDSEKFIFPSAEDTRKFLTVPDQVTWISCNLEIANMDWEDWADSAEADPSGVFRGFD